MDADTHHVRVLAHRVRQQGDTLREDAHGLVARARAVGWTGLSAIAMVHQTELQSRALERIADRHEAAARALESHAAAVEETVRVITEIERRVLAAVDAARGRVRRFLGGLLDAVDHADEVLAGFTPPASGSPLWLDVRLPGVSLPVPELRRSQR